MKKDKNFDSNKKISITEFQLVVDDCINQLANEDAYTFKVLMCIQKVSTPSVETLGVYVKESSMFLNYNPKFLGGLSNEEIVFCLSHELMHILLHHCTYRASVDPKRRKLENIAMDLAINSILPVNRYCKFPVYKHDHPEMGINKGDLLGLHPKNFNLEENLNFESYLDLIEKDMPPALQKLLDNLDSFKDINDPDYEPNPIEVGDHSGFAESSIVDAEIREIVDRISKSNSWGDKPGGYIEAVRKAQQAEVSWFRYLHYSLGKMISSVKKSSRRLFSRRQGWPYPGETYSTYGTIDVYTDTSASVGTFELEKFTAEIARINTKIKVRLWCFDAEVQNPDKPILFRKKNLMSIDFKGRGGTNFQVAIDHAEKHNITQMVILTDGECETPTVTNKNMKIIWCLTPGHDGIGKDLPGTVIYMKKG